MTLDAVGRYTGLRSTRIRTRPRIARCARRSALRDVWARASATDALFLYLHVPFCEMRCGFCNLFTLSRPAKSR